VVAWTVQPIALAQVSAAANMPRMFVPVRIIVPRLAHARTSVNTLRAGGEGRARQPSTRYWHFALQAFVTAFFAQVS
jgi:hypothetical protein